MQVLSRICFLFNAVFSKLIRLYITNIPRFTRTVTRQILEQYRENVNCQYKLFEIVNLKWCSL